jgi:septation ring formation regulator EzrA
MGLFGPKEPIPIDPEIQRVKGLLDQVKLNLKQVNANMSAIRAQYSQHHVHGGGKLGGFVRGVQRSGKDHALAKLQPTKNNLTQQKINLENQLAQLKALKAQGKTHVVY